jgi:hypothetical protein
MHYSESPASFVQQNKLTISLSQAETQTVRNAMLISELTGQSTRPDGDKTTCKTTNGA